MITAFEFLGTHKPQWVKRLSPEKDSNVSCSPIVLVSAFVFGLVATLKSYKGIEGLLIVPLCVCLQ